jgi:hypothetical protein
LGRPSLLAPDRKEIDRESELGSTGRIVNAICSITSSHYIKQQRTNGVCVQHHRGSGKMKKAKIFFR